MLFSHCSAQRRTLDDGLNEVALLQRLREVVLEKTVSCVIETFSRNITYIHLRIQAFLAIAQHSVGRQSDDRGPTCPIDGFPLSNLTSSFEATLVTMLVCVASSRSLGSTYHDRHLDVHQYNVILLQFDGF